MSRYLFAYGTLQLGCAPQQMEGVVARLREVGKGFIRGRLYDLGGYPGAVPDANTPGKIFGTVLELPDVPEILRRLDVYEECDPKSLDTSEYVRELRKVELIGGGSLTCWFYRYNWETDERRMIASGSWLSTQRNLAD